MHKPNQKLKLYILIAVLLTLALTALYFRVEAPTQDEIPAGSAAVTGEAGDLVAFSVMPGSSVTGKITATGSVKGGYFFEGNIIVIILDANKNVLKEGNGTATTEWTTTDPVSFTTNLDFTGIGSGAGYIRLQNDNPSGDPAREKHIDIPVVFQ